MIQVSNCCCSNNIGFDKSAWNISTICFQGFNTIVDLADVNIDRMSECLLVFAGLDNSCANVVKFPNVNWLKVQNYIKGGGRLWLQSEHAAGCVFDGANLNSFLAALGSAIRWAGTNNTAGVACDKATASCTPGAANIAKGASLQIAAASTITGGTSVWLDNIGNVVVAVEKIGQGFIFLTGDSNITGGCAYNNCAFLKRLFDYADNEII